MGNGGLFCNLMSKSVPARQLSWAVAFLSTLIGAEGGPPLLHWQAKQEIGTYIYSLLYTHTGLLGLSPLWSLKVVNVMEELVTTWAG
jgi:hypothetical protein